MIKLVFLFRSVTIKLCTVSLVLSVYNQCGVVLDEKMRANIKLELDVDKFSGFFESCAHLVYNVREKKLDKIINKELSHAILGVGLRNLP
jgi:hypothetical protein